LSVFFCVGVIFFFFPSLAMSADENTPTNHQSPNESSNDDIPDAETQKLATDLCDMRKQALQLQRAHKHSVSTARATKQVLHVTVYTLCILCVFMFMFGPTQPLLMAILELGVGAWMVFNEHMLACVVGGCTFPRTLFSKEALPFDSPHAGMVGMFVACVVVVALCWYERGSQTRYETRSLHANTAWRALDKEIAGAERALMIAWSEEAPHSLRNDFIERIDGLKLAALRLHDRYSPSHASLLRGCRDADLVHYERQAELYELVGWDTLAAKMRALHKDHAPVDPPRVWASCVFRDDTERVENHPGESGARRVAEAEAELRREREAMRVLREQAEILRRRDEEHRKQHTRAPSESKKDL
jgi:hypothetical protein